MIFDLSEAHAMTRTLILAAALAVATALSPPTATAQGLQLEVRPSAPPDWLDPPNTPIPGTLEGSQRRLVYEMMVLDKNSAFVGQPDRYGQHLLPRRRELGDLPPFIEFE
jgi:ABC-type transport system substrate-binding protein